MEQPHFKYDALDPVPWTHGLLGVLSSFLLFHLISHIVQAVARPKTLEGNIWRWNNLMVSLIHATTSSLCIIPTSLRYPDIFNDPVAFHNGAVYCIVCFSTGYFCHDLVSILRKGIVRIKIGTTLHHISIIGIYLYIIVTCRGLSYAFIVLLSEVNSVFLHTRKLMKWCKMSVRKPLLFRFVQWINVITFLTNRFPAAGSVILGLYFWHYRITHFFYVTATAATTIVLAINIYLFATLVISDILSQPKKVVDRKEMNGKQG